MARSAGAAAVIAGGAAPAVALSQSSAPASSESAPEFACKRDEVAPGRKVGADGSPMAGPDGRDAADVLRDIRVTDPRSGEKTAALGDLWKDKPVMVHLVRRFGCPLCREAAADLSTLRPAIDAAGGTMVAIGCQTEGWKDFSEGKFFAGDVFVDADKESFSALGLKRSGLHDGYGFFDPASWTAVFRSWQRGVKGDLKGDGFQMGGTFVIVNGKCVYDHRMQSPGDKPDVAEIETALSRALDSSSARA